jgi:hypothetical protein
MIGKKNKIALAHLSQEVSMLLSSLAQFGIVYQWFDVTSQATLIVSFQCRLNKAGL